MNALEQSVPRHRPLLLTAVVCISTATSTFATDGPRNDNPLRSNQDKAIDAAARSYFANSCHAGLSVAMVTSGQTRVYNYGVANREHGTLPTADSVYEIASVTKSFTASLAAHAVHEGKMSMTGDFRAYLKGSYPNLERGGLPITLATLLTHRSGMPRDIPDSDAIFAAKNPHTLPEQLLALNRGRNEGDFLRDLHRITLQGTPGADERYSNAGFTVIGAGLENVYRTPYETLLQRRVLGPLQMTSTSLTLSPNMAARGVTGYDMFGKPAPTHPDNAGAAWGLWSTPADLARFVRWQLRDADPVVALSHKPLVRGDGEEIAMAWHVETLGDMRVISHGGGSFGTSSQIVLLPNVHRGYALLANDTCAGTEHALKELALAADSRL